MGAPVWLKESWESYKQQDEQTMVSQWIQKKIGYIPLRTAHFVASAMAASVPVAYHFFLEDMEIFSEDTERILRDWHNESIDKRWPALDVTLKANYDNCQWETIVCFLWNECAIELHRGVVTPVGTKYETLVDIVIGLVETYAVDMVGHMSMIRPGTWWTKHKNKALEMLLFSEGKHAM